MSRKILHVSPSYYPAFTFGGPIQSVHLLNKSLAKIDCDVDVYTTNAGLKTNKLYNSNKAILLDNLNVRYFSFWGYEHYNFSPPLFWALLFNVKKYDLVHITAVWNFPVWASCFACWWHKVPYIISPRGTIYPETIEIKSSRFKKIYLKLIALRCLLKAEAIHCTSVDEEVSIKSTLGITKTFVVPNGISLENFISKSDSPINLILPNLKNKKFILFLGRIDKKKGLDISLKALKSVFENHQELYFVIAGPDNSGYQSEIEKLAIELHIDARIIFTGNLNVSQKISAYKNAELFLLSSYSENFGMSVIEAMACNCPVIISNKVGISPEIKTNNAGIITTLDPVNISEEILNLLENPTLKNTIKTNAFKMVHDHYSIEEVAHKIKNVYDNIIKKWPK